MYYSKNKYQLEMKELIHLYQFLKIANEKNWLQMRIPLILTHSTESEREFCVFIGLKMNATKIMKFLPI